MPRQTKFEKEVEAIIKTAQAIKSGSECFLFMDKYVIMSKSRYQEALQTGRFNMDTMPRKVKNEHE